MAGLSNQLQWLAVSAQTLNFSKKASRFRVNQKVWYVKCMLRDCKLPTNALTKKTRTTTTQIAYQPVAVFKGVTASASKSMKQYPDNQIFTDICLLTINQRGNWRLNP